MSVTRREEIISEKVKNTLRILLIEDDPDDAELIAVALQDAGFDASFQRVETAAEMSAALESGEIHAILSDYALPGFGAQEALATMQAHNLDLPFLIVSGEIGESVAVALMKAGVHDYVAKDNLARLAPAIERELRDAAIRHARREAEASLRASQQRHETLLQSIDGIVWEADALPGVYTFVSQQAEKLLGYPIRRWTEDPAFWANNIHEADREWVSKNYQQAMAKGQPFQLEYRRQTADGDFLWLRDVVSIAQDGSGAEVQRKSLRFATVLRGVTFDVTERRAIEDERERLLSLTEQRAREMSIIASISAALRTATSRQDTLVVVMDTLRQLLPFRALSYHRLEDGVIGPSELSAGEWPPGWLARLETNPGTATLLISAFESVVLPPLGAEFSELRGKMVALPLRAQGKLVGVLWGHYQPYNMEDNPTTPLSIAENRLLTALADIIAGAIYRAGLYEETRVMARQMEEMMTSTSQGMILLDEHGHILLANPAAQRAIALLAPESGDGTLTHLAGRPLILVHRNLQEQSGQDDTITPDIFQPDQEESGAQESGSATPAIEWSFEVTIESPVHSTFEVILRPVDTEFSFQSWMLILNDVTQERLEQKRIHEQNRLAAVGQLAAGIAHDFNNSLGVIRLYTELVQRHGNLSERDHSRLEIVSKQIAHATHLIHQILDFSRRSIIDRKILDLHQLLTNFLEMLERTLGEHVELTYEHENKAIMIEGDRTRLQQAIFNLAVNGRDAMPDGGRMTFRLKTHTVVEAGDPPLAELTPGRWVSLAISDSGHGIENEHLSQLYEPFFTTKPAGHGTGLGLAQVYGIVKQHHGYISVDTQVGQGTTFTLYFPIEGVAEIQEGAPEPAPETITPRRLLVVEDDPAGREALRETLQEYGYEVSTAENGLAALEQIEEQPNYFDLIVSDLVMPQMSGIQLLNHLRTHHIHLPMIAITGYPLADGGQELLEQGIVDWLAKPFRAEALLQKIESALQS